METCSNCGAVIGNLEETYHWKEQPICFICQEKLTKAERIAGRAKEGYPDPLWVPRSLSLLIAVAVTFALMVSGSRDVPSYAIVGIVWMAWAVMSLVGMVQKANWKERNGQ